MSLLPPLVAFETITRAELNACLIAWGHQMGPWSRPSYRGGEGGWFHGLRHDGRLVAVTAAGDLIRERCAGLARADAVELARVCAERKHLNRITLRLWREFVFPSLCRAHGWVWVVSYQDAVVHSGDLYRFDGWIRLGQSSSGTDARSGRKGRRKVIWGWHLSGDARAALVERERLGPEQRSVARPHFAAMLDLDLGAA